MSEKILVPVLGESITEATVAKWLKHEGDSVAADEAIVELETDKVNLEVPSPIDGVLSEINSKDGETVEVGALLGSISENRSQPVEKKIITKIEPKKVVNNVVSLDIEKKEPDVLEEKESKKEEPLVLYNEIEDEESNLIKKNENNVVNLEIKKEVPKVFKEPEKEEPLILTNEVKEETPLILKSENNEDKPESSNKNKKYFLHQ